MQIPTLSNSYQCSGQGMRAIQPLRSVMNQIGKNGRELIRNVIEMSEKREEASDRKYYQMEDRQVYKTPIDFSQVIPARHFRRSRYPTAPPFSASLSTLSSRCIPLIISLIHRTSSIYRNFGISVVYITYPLGSTIYR